MLTIRQSYISIQNKFFYSGYIINNTNHNLGEHQMIAIVGLGLIGGSFAKALKACGETVVGIDKNKAVLRAAMNDHAVDSDNANDIAACDIILLCLYPKDIPEFIRANADRFKREAVMMDMCGVKSAVVASAQKALLGSRRGDIKYIGCHPMAGKEQSGYSASDKDLFIGRSFIVTVAASTDSYALQAAKDIAEHAGFGHTVETSPENHDRIIALTSQLAHVVSSAYIKSPTAPDADGFTAGSFQDMTRVALLNEEMWTELFLMNSRNLIFEINNLIWKLDEYRDALSANDADRLCALLKDGREKKETLLKNTALL
jgi:prephenate dehydrogenase